MKKYNKSNIMKRAWELVKTAGMTIFAGLKKAWKEAKETIIEMTGSEKQILWAMDIKARAMDTIELLRKNYMDFVDRASFETDGGTSFALSMLKYDLAAVDVVAAEINYTFEMTNKAATIIENRAKFNMDNLKKMAQMEYSTGAISAAQARR